MRYLGGKYRIGKQISEVLNLLPTNLKYYEPFVGGNNIIPHIKDFAEFNASDVNEDLILMYQALKDGWIPPDSISKEEYEDLRTSSPSALRAFAGFGCSFSGKWFGGYAKDNSGRNYCLNAKNSILKKLPSIKKTNFTCNSYQSLEIYDSIIYSDPPYKGTTQYDYCKNFNHDEFWTKVREWKNNGNIVLVSEYSAPEDFVAIKEMTTKTDMRTKLGKELRIEKIFI